MRRNSEHNWKRIISTNSLQLNRRRSRFFSAKRLSPRRSRRNRLIRTESRSLFELAVTRRFTLGRELYWIGIVDENGRALLDVRISDQADGNYTPVATWIDTAFDGHLVFPRELINTLGLESLAETEAVLADGSTVALETFLCFVDWFGSRMPLQVVANEGRFPLLGTGLLEQRVLRIDYKKGELSLE